MSVIFRAPEKLREIGDPISLSVIMVRLMDLEAAVSVAELNTEEMRRSEEITDEADIETGHISEHGRSLSSSCRLECRICQVEDSIDKIEAPCQCNGTSMENSSMEKLEDRLNAMKRTRNWAQIRRIIIMCPKTPLPKRKLLAID